jgi:hypothetical protein
MEQQRWPKPDLANALCEDQKVIRTHSGNGLTLLAPVSPEVSIGHRVQLGRAIQRTDM